MPEATLNAVADHGGIREVTIQANFADAQQVLDDRDAVGIDYSDVVVLLEEEGVGKFETSWALVVDHLGDRLRAAQATPLSKPTIHALTVDTEATTP